MILMEKDIKLKKQSTWTTDKGRDKWLDTYIEEVKDDVLNSLLRNACTKSGSLRFSQFSGW